jgi:hypothetical protein
MPDIVGTWRLVGAVSTDPDGRPLPAPYGPQAIGRIVFTADRRVMVAVCDGRPQLPAGTRREYVGYCGDYTFDGTTLTTSVCRAEPGAGRYLPGARRALRRRADGLAATAARDRGRDASSRTDLGTHQPGLASQTSPAIQGPIREA